MYTEVGRWDARMRMRTRKEARWEDGGRNERERERESRQQMVLAGSTTDGDSSARLRTGCWSAVGGRDPSSLTVVRTQRS